MTTVRITEADLARNIHTVLAQVQQGVEVIVEQLSSITVIELEHGLRYF